jgi:hypothetical protein
MDQSMAIGSADFPPERNRAPGPTRKRIVMHALLFIVVFALVLGAAQLLGWTRDSRDSKDWHAPEEEPAMPDRQHSHAA